VRPHPNGIYRVIHFSASGCTRRRVARKPLQVRRHFQIFTCSARDESVPKRCQS
jgi:hypothetical protein